MQKENRKKKKGKGSSETLDKKDLQLKYNEGSRRVKHNRRKTTMWEKRFRGISKTFQCLTDTKL